MGGSGSVACQEFITQLAATCRSSSSRPTRHGQKVRNGGSDMASTDSASAPAGPDPYRR